MWQNMPIKIVHILWAILNSKQFVFLRKFKYYIFFLNTSFKSKFDINVFILVLFFSAHLSISAYNVGFKLMCSLLSLFSYISAIISSFVSPVLFCIFYIFFGFEIALVLISVKKSLADFSISKSNFIISPQILLKTLYNPIRHYLLVHN